jgi:hypothetical protein
VCIGDEKVAEIKLNRVRPPLWHEQISAGNLDLRIDK